MTILNIHNLQYNNNDNNNHSTSASSLSTTSASFTSNTGCCSTTCGGGGGGGSGGNSNGYNYNYNNIRLMNNNINQSSPTSSWFWKSFQIDGPDYPDNNNNNNNANNENDNHKQEIDDAELAKEMNELSIEEREKVYDDIHGIVVDLETDETKLINIKKLCKELDSVISKMPSIQKKAYSKALLLCPTLKYDTKWKMMFLRADLYSPTKAALRLIKYYDQKEQLWGEDKLTKRITINDLSDDDLYWYLIGFQIVLPYRDQANRPLMFLNTTTLDCFNDLDDINLKSMLRSWWYMTMATLQNDINAQKTGICFITMYSTDKLLKPNTIGKSANIGKRRGYMKSCLPCRIASTRVCYDDNKYLLLLGAMRWALGKAARLRLRAHCGSDLEHDYFLMTVGIQTQGLIQRVKNGEKMDFYEQFIRNRKIIDKQLDDYEQQQERQTQIVISPNQNDVLIGRGVPYQNFTCNKRWNQLIYENLDRYSVGKQFEKTCISMEMVKIIQHKYSGRFLQRSEKGWTILKDSVAREKAASAFRTRSRPTAAGIHHKAGQ